MGCNIMFFLKNTKRVPGYTLLTIVFTILFSILQIGLSYILAISADAIASGASPFSIVMKGVVIYTAFFFVSAFVQEYSLSKFLVKIREILLTRFSEYFMHTRSATSVAGVQNIFTQELTTVINNYFREIILLLMVGSAFLFGTIYAFIISPVLILFLIVVIAITVVINGIFSKPLANNMEKLQKENAELNKILAGVIPSTLDMRLYRAYGFGVNLINKQTRSQLMALWKNDRFLVLVGLFNNAVALFVQMGAIFISLYYLSLGVMTLGETLAVIMLLQHIVSPLSLMMGKKNKIDSTKKLRDTFESYVCNSSESIITTVKLPEKSMDVIFDNVTFGYSEETFVLNNINLKFEANKKYLLLGKSGSGKSTLANLLIHKICNYSGDIFFGKNKAYENLEEIEAICAYVQQQTTLMPINVFQNIALSEIYDENRMKEVLKHVELHLGVIDLNQNVSENQDNFSGGEAQKIILARLLYHFENKQILVFDEFTSSLDIINAANIEKLILGLNKTVISISHRFDEETLGLYDSLIILKNGHVEYSGSTRIGIDEIERYL